MIMLTVNQYVQKHKMTSQRQKLNLLLLWLLDLARSLRQKQHSSVIGQQSLPARHTDQIKHAYWQHLSWGVLSVRAQPTDLLGSDSGRLGFLSDVSAHCWLSWDTASHPEPEGKRGKRQRVCWWLFVARDDAHRAEHITTGKNRKQSVLVQTKELVSAAEGEGRESCCWCGPWWTDGVGYRERMGERDTERDKNKRQRSRGSRVADRCDVQHSAQSVVQVEKASLCDADDNAISPALSRPMGSAPRDIESQTLILWVCVLWARSEKQCHSTWGVCGWGSLRRGLTSLMVDSPSSSSCLGFSLRPSSVTGFAGLNIKSIILIICMTQNSHEGCDRTRRHTDQFISAFWANSLKIFRLMNNFIGWIKQGNLQWQRHKIHWFHTMVEEPSN